MEAGGSSVLNDCVRSWIDCFGGSNKPAKSMAGGREAQLIVAAIADGEYTKETLYRRGFLRTQCRRRAMQVVYARCAGLDVHKKTVGACVNVC
jgi:hypothetical protein